jgi:hypothetical protein
MSQNHYFCPLCSSANVFQNYPALFIHIRNQHREESVFNIRCELSAFCGSRYSSFNSYRQHIYRCHRALIDSFDNHDILNDHQESFPEYSFDNQPNLIVDSDFSIYEEEDLDETDFIPPKFDHISFSPTDEQLNLDKFSYFYTQFLLELREYHLLPQKVVQSISTNVCTLFHMMVELIKMKKSSNILPVIDLETTFAHIIRIIDSTSKSEYTFLKQCEKFFDYRQPKEIILNAANERAYYVPLKESLSDVFRSGELFRYIVDNIQSLITRSTKDNDLILSNRQCQTIQSNISRQKHSNTLLLKLYTDGIGITNPIGPKKDAHKLTCFYYLLDDLPDTVKSQISSIGLHCLSYTKHLNDENKRHTLMNVLVNDVNSLQNDGISIPCLSSRIYFVFSCLCGDNLSSNEIGGFQKNFNSGNFCRHCYISYEQRHIPLTDISFAPRTRLRHDIILREIMDMNDRRTVQGVTSCSWFKDLIGFYPTDSLPCDLMHDTAEGNTLKK